MAYRLLSLDGGGAWALIQVRALIRLYGDDDTTEGHRVLSDFDLVAANSGGSLVLGGLVENLKLGELLKYFEDEGKRRSIFSPTKSVVDWATEKAFGIGPKYSAKAKLPALERLLPDRGNEPLAKVAQDIKSKGSGDPLRLLIVGFDYDRNRATFFRSAPAGGPSLGTGEAADVTLAEAIHASTNAPVNYFDAPAEFPGAPNAGRYWDGGITGCNNPVLAGVTEALVRGQQPRDVVALSIGTATVKLPWPDGSACPACYLQQPSGTGLVSDLGKLARAILDDPPDVASFIAHMMTGGPAGLPAGIESRIVRMNPLISPVKVAGTWTAPGDLTAAQFTHLADLDMDAIEQHDVDAISEYADLWLKDEAPNQPIRMNGDTLEREVGPDRFSGVLAAWRALTSLPPSAARAGV